MRRLGKFFLWIYLLGASCGAALGNPSKPGAEKVLRYAFKVAETGFDPAQVSDLYSRTITANIFDGLYSYDYLARPAKVMPNLAADLPVISDDYKTFTIKLKPGIFFSDDPAFQGKKREVVAQDIVYSFKRVSDPKNRSPAYSSLAEDGIVGLDVLRKAATAPGTKCDYDLDIEGLRALDRYTVQFKLRESRPRFIYTLTDSGILGAVAREVVEKYADTIMEHPVGTGPYRLAEWRRSSKITLRKNPNYREVFYHAEPPAGDAVSQAIYQRMKGKRLPIIDQVEVSIIEESQPRWLAFLGREHDLLERLPEEVANIAIPNNVLAPHLVKQGIVMERVAATDVTVSYFSMDNPVVGGYSPEKVALRRAIGLAYNSAEEVRLPRRNQAIVSQGPTYPGTFGYDAKRLTEMGVFDRARATALLDMFGYIDRNGDGWRDLPDGKPLVLEYANSPNSLERELAEIWKRNMDAVNLKIVFKTAQWPENLKAARANKLMMWGLGYSASTPDSGGLLELGYSPSAGLSNLSRFKNEKFDALYQRQKLLPDGPERAAVMQEAVKLLVAYMPIKFNTHRFVTDMTHPWVIGYRRHPLARDFWKFIDIEPHPNNPLN